MLETGRITNTNEYGEPIVNCNDLMELVYQGYDIDKVKVNDDRVEKYNSIIKDLALDWPEIQKLTNIDIDVKDYDKALQSDWYMPKSYKDMDIENHIRQLAKTTEEKIRVEEELILYRKYSILNVLKFLVYLIDTMRENNIVWGVGRGSSVSSYVLYLIGVHKVDSIKYDLDVTEFLKDK
jgi:DNA polymerase III alpha subunit|tara:strand:+ start:484 stop:1023 length:540 start_codon:yes stop_codon:yes gene_type:complete